MTTPNGRASHPARCPTCGQWIAFLVDRAGATAALCGCGSRLVPRRSPTRKERDLRPRAQGVRRRPSQ